MHDATPTYQHIIRRLELVAKEVVKFEQTREGARSSSPRLKNVKDTLQTEMGKMWRANE